MGRPAAWAAAVTLAALAPVHAQAQATCLDSLGGEAGGLRSRWEERGPQGQVLVREQGTLALAAFTLSTRCLPGHWSLQAAHAQGERSYDGRSTTGMPLRSTSRLRTEQLRLQALTDDATGFSFGLRVGAERIARDIASVGATAGYPERFTLATFAAGLRHQAPAGAGAQLMLEAWAGGGPPGRLRLQPPGFDAATLRLGASREALLALQLASPGPASAGPGWRWQLRLQCVAQHMAAGPGGALTRNGVLVGGAAQPATRRSECGASAGATWQFG